MSSGISSRFSNWTRNPSMSGIAGNDRPGILTGDRGTFWWTWTW